MIMLYTMFSMPFSLWMLKGFIDEIPKEFDDAALADGASIPRVVFDVILPQLGTALVAVIIFNIIFVWNEFLFALILTGPETRTVPVEIASGVACGKGVEWGFISSSATIYILPVVAAVFFLQKYFLRGLSFGSIKG
jgi:multiple sugar transport system permease protein